MRDEIGKALKEALKTLGASKAAFALERSDTFEHGDYATNAALIAAKILKKNPKEVAEALKKELEGKIEGVRKIEVAGAGFINFFLSDQVLNKTLRDIISAGDTWGSAPKIKERWLIEHTSPNPNKAMHIGHLRNNITGMAIANIAEFRGVEVIRDCIDNNRGIAIAKLMWGYVKFAHRGGTPIEDISYWHEHQGEWQTPEEMDMRPDRFVDALYVQGSEDFEHSLDVEKKVRQMVVDWEHKEKIVWELWEKVLAYSYAGQRMTLGRLGNKWDRVWHEHEHYQEGKNLVEDGLRKGVFKKLEDGAVLTNLAAYNLPDTIVMKSDGTSLYITQDIALTRLKRDTYHPDRLFWVIGPEQTLALKQVFAVCEQLGIGKYTDYTHISYGYMSLKGEAKMSSRKGNVLFIDDLIDQVKESVKDLLKEAELPASKIETIAEEVAVGAVKFGILKVGRNSSIVFDVERATDLHGDTGPYVQYAHTRTCSLLKHAEGKGMKSEVIEDAEANEVVRLLAHFPNVVERSNSELEPHYIATYLLELASLFSRWYADVHILDDASDRGHKIAIVDAVRITLGNGLRLLGIPAPEEM